MGLFDFIFGKQASSELPGHEASRKILDWRASKPHLMLLERFLGPQDTKGHFPYELTESLGEPIQAALGRFHDENMLIPSSLTAQVDMAFTTADLEGLLEERGLPTSGKKFALAERLAAADFEGMTAKVAHRDMLECSAEARIIVETYTNDARKRKDAVIAECVASLRAGDIGRAMTALSQEYVPLSQPDAKSTRRQLETIFSSRPKILVRLAETDWAPLRVAAAMIYLSGENKARLWLPDGFCGLPKFDNDVVARMLMFHAQHRLNIEQMREVGITEAEICSCSDSCAPCRAFADKKMSIDKMPELPHAGCTHKMGCRCCVMAAIC